MNVNLILDQLQSAITKSTLDLEQDGQHQLTFELALFDQKIPFSSDVFVEQNGYLPVRADLPTTKIGFPASEVLDDLLAKELLPQKLTDFEVLQVIRLQCIYSLSSGIVQSLDIGLKIHLEIEIIAKQVLLSVHTLNLLLKRAQNSTQTSASLEGEIHIGDVSLHAEMLLPETGLILEYKSAQPIQLSKLVQDMIPIEAIPNCDIERIRGEVELESGQYMLQCLIAGNTPPSFMEYFPSTESKITVFVMGNKNTVSAAIEAELEVGGSEIKLGTKLQKEYEVWGEISFLSFKDLLSLFGWQLASFPDIQLLNGGIKISHDGKLEMQGSLEMDFFSLALAWGIPIPESLNNFPFDTLNLSGDLLSKDLQLDLSLTNAVPLLKGSASEVSIVGANLSIVSASEYTLSLTLHGKTEITPQAQMTFEYLRIQYDPKIKSWTAASEVELQLFDHNHKLAVDLNKDAIRLNYQGEIRVLKLGEHGKVAINQLSVFTEKEENGEEESQRWGMGGDIIILQQDHSGKPWLDLEGQLAVETGEAGRKLAISAQAPTIPNIKLDLDGAFQQSPEISLGLDQFGLEYIQEEQEKKWMLVAKANMQILHIPKLLDAYLPAEKLEGYFQTDGKQTLLGFDVPSTLQPSLPRLEMRFAEGANLDLGQPSLTIEAIELDLSKKPVFREKLHIGLPRELNYIFGKKGNKPKKILFNEGFGLQLELGAKLGLKLNSSPLAPLEFFSKEEDKGAFWTRWDLEGAGIFDFRVPEFEYNKHKWKASGGFERIGETSIPLTPIKKLLELSGVPSSMLGLLPDGIPLVDLNFEDGSFAQQLDMLFGDLLRKAPKEIKEALDFVLDIIAKAIKTLPENFQEYFKVEIPRSLILEMGVDAIGGGSSLGLRILEKGELPLDQKPKPIKILLPVGMDILGLTIRGLHIGQKASGSMIQIEYDGHIDRFNLLEMAFAIPLQKKNIRSRFVLNKTKFLIPSGLPVPIPLFYDQIGMDYKDVLGMELETYWGNPDPEWSLSNYLGMFGALISFATDKQYLFSDNEFNKVLNTQLNIGIQRFQMPAFLGGKEIVLNMHEVSLDTGRLIGGTMDFFKTGNAAYIIEAVPLKASEQHWIRLGAVDLNFGPLLGIQANWCITTQREFQEEVLPAVQANPSLAKALHTDVLTILPKDNKGKSMDKGFIVLMGGAVDFGGVLGLEAQFGMAFTGQSKNDGHHSRGFETGFLLKGSIAQTLALKVGGKLLVSHDSESGQRLQLDGAIQLMWKDKNLIKTEGMIAVERDKFEVQIILSLTDHFSIGGLLEIGKERFLLQGTVSWGHDGNANTYSALMQIDRHGLTIGFDWSLHDLEGEIRILTPGREGRLFTASASLRLNEGLMGKFQEGIKHAAASIAESAVDEAYKGMQEAVASFEDAEISVRGLRKSLPPLCTGIVNRINSSIDRNTRGWKRPGRGPAKRKARPFINRVNRIAHVARHSSDKNFRRDLKNALQSLLDNNHLRIRLSIGVKPFKKTFTVYSGKPITGNNLTNLKRAIDNIHRLQDTSTLRAKKVEQYVSFPPRDRILAEINNAVDENIPEVEAISFETSLGLLNASSMRVSVKYTYQGKARSINDVEVDFTNPAKLSEALVAAFE